MIQKIDAFKANCDQCGERFENHDFNIFADEDTIEQEMDNNEWIDGSRLTEPQPGKWYCGNCWHMDDKDNYVLNAPPHPIKQY